MFTSLLLGYLIMYAPTKLSIASISFLFLVSMATLIKPVGYFAGELLLMKKNVQIKTDRFSYHGDILYDGRKSIHLYDYKLKKVIILDKNKIVGE
jgi:hypothetical protein